MQDIVLFWIRWSWKWTQATKIKKHYKNKFSHFDPGSILRAIKSSDNCLSEYIKKTVEKWKLIDESFIISLFDAYLVSLEKTQYMLVDGFPRKWGQMFLFIDRMQRARRKFVPVLLEIPEEESIKRQSARRVCTWCNNIYNILLDGEIEQCSLCGAKLVQRSDDKPNMIKQRIKVHNEEIVPIIKYFDVRWDFVKIDATRSKDEVFEDIKKIIEWKKLDS